MPKFWIFGKLKDATSQLSDIKNIADEKPRIEKITQVLENHDLSSNNIQNLHKEAFPSVHYGVSLPSNINCDEKPLVFTDKNEAVKAVKCYKGARFKAFPTKEEAICFALQIVHETPISVHEKGLGVEKAAEYPSLSRQDIVKFRKSIEAGDIDSFKATLASNPRYLASSVDTPMIMMEGYRYNALHVAAKHMQPELCELVIEAVEDPALMEKLYPDNSPKIRSERTTYLIDLYLNMPDKRLSETPLHFASKFGCLKAVEILVSHPACDRRRKNKSGLEAKDIICDRCPFNPKLKQDILEAFEGKFFVPVLRSDDNSVQPIIGKPYSPEQMSNLRKAQSPCSPELSIKAKAGPMSPTQAMLFHKQWKTPPNRFGRNNYNSYRIRLSDTDKGLERIGRELAHELKTQWSEYWPILNTWCDLSSPGGLKLLEEHLAYKFRLVSVKHSAKTPAKTQMPEIENSPKLVINSENAIESPSCNSQSPLSISKNSSGGINLLCSGLESFHVTELANISSETSHYGSNTSTAISGSGDQPNKKQVNSDLKSVPSATKAFNISEKGDHYFTNENAPSNNCRLKETGDDGQCTKSPVKNNASKFKSAMATFIHSMKMEPCLEISNKDTSTHLSVIESGGHGSNGLLFAESEIVKKILEVIVSNTFNADSSFDNGKKIRSFFCEDVLPKIQCLLKLTQIAHHQQDLSLVHERVANRIYKEMQRQLTVSEMGVARRCLMSYMEYQLSIHSSSSDDDDEEVQKVRRRAGNTNSYQTEVPSPWRKLKWQHLQCILKFLCVIITNDSSNSCRCSWSKKNGCLNITLQSSDELENSTITENDDSSTKTSMKLHFSDDVSDKSSETDSDEYVTPPSSPLPESCSFNLDENVALEESCEVYVDGYLPSKADADMFRAIEKVTIDTILYPHISRWKCLISSKDNQTVESWASPAVEKYRRYKPFLSRTLPLSPIAPRNLFH